jgi:hypothetical protein
MNTAAESIMAYAGALSEGEAFSAKELLHIAERDTVDQALSRLVRRGRLIRVGRGLYTVPVRSRFGERPPAPETVAASVARRTGETIAPSGAVSANRLGLTTQNPVRTVYWTSGRSRTLTVGKQTVEFRHVPSWQLRGGETRAGEALRALAWMGREGVANGIEKLGTRLTPAERGEVAAFRTTTPTWLSRELSRFVANG